MRHVRQFSRHQYPKLDVVFHLLRRIGRRHFRSGQYLLRSLYTLCHGLRHFPLFLGCGQRLTGGR